MVRQSRLADLRDRISQRRLQINQQLRGMAYYTHRRSQLEWASVQPSDIVFLGDSITDEGEWSAWFPQVSIHNFGISGDTTTGVLRRLGNILNGTPRKLFLMIGINDLVNQGKLPERVLIHYEQILQRIQTRSPHTQVYVQSVLPVGDRPHAEELNRKVLVLNRGLTSLATQFNYTYLDLHASFLANTELNRAYTHDGIHLNAQGYALWIQLIRTKVETPL